MNFQSNSNMDFNPRRGPSKNIRQIKQPPKQIKNLFWQKCFQHSIEMERKSVSPKRNFYFGKEILPNIFCLFAARLSVVGLLEWTLVYIC